MIQTADKKRLIGIDILRIFSVFMIFVFHTQHIDCQYGPLRFIINNGALFYDYFLYAFGFCFIVYQQRESLHRT